MVSGLFFGLLREKTDDVVACTIAHGGSTRWVKDWPL
jgi:hypothetical protein